jgi:hypothetical protein
LRDGLGAGVSIGSAALATVRVRRVAAGGAWRRKPIP